MQTTASMLACLTPASMFALPALPDPKRGEDCVWCLTSVDAADPESVFRCGDCALVYHKQHFVDGRHPLECPACTKKPFPGKNKVSGRPLTP